MDTLGFPYKHIHLPQVESTNGWAKEHLELCPVDGVTLIDADYQTGGRGQFARKWHSPHGQNILATFVFFLPEQSYENVQLVQLLAESAQMVLKSHGIASIIKWPNDLLVNQKKIAGILIETIPQEELVAIVMGIGLNVNMTQQELDGIDQPATSIAVELKQYVAREEVLSQLQSHFLQQLRPLLTSEKN